MIIVSNMQKDLQMSQASKTVSISVARVGHGGNTSEGQYFYSFDPQNILIEDPDTAVEFVLSKETSESIKIWKIVTSNPEQFRDFKRASNQRSASLVNANTMEELISVSVLVTDSANEGRVINCDPQMLNVPR